MIQVKMFGFADVRVQDMEGTINKWLASLGEGAEIIDIKITSYCTPDPECYSESNDVLIIYRV
jgi:hypothetical protein